MWLVTERHSASTALPHSYYKQEEVDCFNQTRTKEAGMLHFEGFFVCFLRKATDQLLVSFLHCFHSIFPLHFLPKHSKLSSILSTRACSSPGDSGKADRISYVKRHHFCNSLGKLGDVMVTTYYILNMLPPW